MDELVRQVTRMGEIRNAFKILTGKREGSNLSEDSRVDFEVNIKVDFTVIGGDMWTVFIWFRILINEGFLRIRQ
jgi:hypothetical protein